ncbi:MAG: hypothetical protein ACRCY4_06655 [Brevinema sp.]
MRLLLLISLVFGANINLFSQMKNVPIFPAGISVEWSALPPVEVDETPAPAVATPQNKEEVADEKPQKVSKWRKPRASSKKVAEASTTADDLEPLAPVVPAVEKAVITEPVAVNRLIRVINAVDLSAGQRFALVFYNEKGVIIPKQLRVVPNTEKPSAARVFFMDKASNRSFKGLLDVYFVPKDATFMNVAIIDQNDKIVKVPTHPAYDAKGFINIEDFLKTEPTSRIMLQFETAGTTDRSVLRLGGFRFGRAR